MLSDAAAGVLYGTAGDDYIEGGDADQVIHTLGGDDTVYGGDGYDVVVVDGSGEPVGRRDRRRATR